MSYDEDEIKDGFSISDDTEDELEPPVEMDFGLDEEDPDKDR
jgi:hypothetical protein